ncbi:uncharacterized protein LOC118751020 [Rhagoletis pomonella]|uniref:uncharacterized protein LOC118751020 n=1 Tax=Rhagoletis pomonella TaxID=28610 RepID=UPI001786DDAE|nr:uncharacterized protein LOC118751020 [Rhagoletis pomonella]
MTDNCLIFGENASLVENGAGQHIFLEATPALIGQSEGILTQVTQCVSLCGNLQQVVQNKSGGVEDDQLKELLKEMSMESAFDALYACGFTYDRLKYINSDDLALIFPGQENIGYRAELGEKLRLWKHQNFPYQCLSSLSMNSTVQNWIENQPLNSSASSSTSVSNSTFY